EARLLESWVHTSGSSSDRSRDWDDVFGLRDQLSGIRILEFACCPAALRLLGRSGDARDRWRVGSKGAASNVHTRATRLWATRGLYASWPQRDSSPPGTRRRRGDVDWRSAPVILLLRAVRVPQAPIE